LCVYQLWHFDSDIILLLAVVLRCGKISTAYDIWDMVMIFDVLMIIAASYDLLERLWSIVKYIHESAVRY
jgi:hypothetical protein